MIKSPHVHVLGGVPGLSPPSLESRQITRKKFQRKVSISRDRTQFFAASRQIVRVCEN